MKSEVSSPDEENLLRKAIALRRIRTDPSFGDERLLMQEFTEIRERMLSEGYTKEQLQKLVVPVSLADEKGRLCEFEAKL